jgi:biopolymer transport protein ExbB
MQHTTEFNSLAFIMQGGPVTISVAMILLVMSVASWYFIVVKTFQAIKIKNAIQNDINAFWEAPNISVALSQQQSYSPVSQLTRFAVEASNHHQTHKTKALEDACSHEEFVVRSMRRSIGQQQAELESGLSILASVGSVAPFVGLFGTVWGIYHALASISASGQATLDKVAGPVGEALIMTAIGLAVAIPAVLAYNAFIKSNRVAMAKLENFAQDLHTLLTTGAPLVAKNSADKTQIKTKPASANLHEVPA